MHSKYRRKKNKKINWAKVFFTIVLMIILISLLSYLVEKNIKKASKSISTSSNTNEIKNKKEENAEHINKNKESKVTTHERGTKNGLPVLMYHFFYDDTKTDGKDENWISTTKFEEQIKYLTDNDFYFPTWNEVDEYLDGKVGLPKKSVVITVDDGDNSFFEFAVPIIQKYNANATSFVITSWYGYRAGSKERNIDYESHSDCMHEGAKNGKGVMLSWDYEKIKEDVKNSSKVLDGAKIFCYPFGQYNDLDKKVLKDAGYKMSFTTAHGRIYEGNDKFALPRIRVNGSTEIESFKYMVK